MKDKNIQDDENSKEQILINIENYGCHLICIEPDNYLPDFVLGYGRVL